MSRERMVTRTITITNVEVMALDVTKAEVITTSFELNGEYTAETALKRIKKNCEDDTMKYVHVEKISTQEILYGMSEYDFMRYAKILPSRTNEK